MTLCPPQTESCPSCGATTGVVRITGTSREQSWLCKCGTEWACTRVGPSPQPYFDRLAATVEELGATQSVLRAVIALADEVPKLTDVELRARLLALADRAARR